jgi:DedD protein
MAVDSALKERLVGAVVLVALGVWLIPLFLDGPQRAGVTGEGRRTLKLPVPSPEKPDKQTKTIRLDGSQLPSRPTPEPVTDPVRESKPLVKPRVEPKPAPKPAPKTSQPAPRPADRSAPVAAGWYLQLGSFSSDANAKRLAAQVNALGWAAQLSQHTSAGKSMHRVRVGPVPTRSKADALRAELAERGFEGKVMNES